MRAAVFNGAGSPLSIEDLPDPEPAPGEVVMKVARCGVCGSDLHMTSGHAMDYPAGTVLGHEFAGEVAAVGKGVSTLSVGDRITAMPATGCGACAACASGYPLGCAGMRGMIGGFGQYMRAAEASAVKLPSSLTLEDGALVEPLCVGLHGVALSEMRAGARVLVIGAGAVGLAAIFWAQKLGAGRIAAASPSKRRAAMALDMGADVFETLRPEENERVRAALGESPDIVFECAGAVGVLQKCVDLVRPGGTIVSLGFCGAPDPISPAMATWKRATIKFSFGYSLSEFQHCVDVLDRGAVEPRMMVTETVGLDALPEVFESLRSGSAQTKVHIDPWMT